MRVAQVAQHAMFSAARGRGSRGLWRRALRSGNTRSSGAGRPRTRSRRQLGCDGGRATAGARVAAGRARCLGDARPRRAGRDCAAWVAGRDPCGRAAPGQPGGKPAEARPPSGACGGRAAVAAFVWGMWVFLKLAEIDPCACGPVPVQYFGTERSGGFLIACRRETWSLGSAGEHRLHTAGVTGSNPVATTMKQQVRSLLLLTFFFASGIFAQARRRPLAPARLRAGLHLRGPPSHPRSRQHAFAPLPSVRNVTHRLR